MKKETLYDRNESKFIERIDALRKQHPKLKVGKIQRPCTVGKIQDDVFEVEVQY